MKILAVIAHPDDETIFLWPIFEKRQIEKHVICAIKDEQRLKALDEVSKILNFTWETVGLDDQNVNLGTEKLSSIISERMTDNPTAVICHNPHGEYQHPDHLAVFNTVYNHKDVENLIVTDMSIDLSGSGFPITPLEIPETERKKYYRRPLCRCTRDRILYDKARKVYKNNNCWTWGKRNFDACTLYFVRSEKYHRYKVIDMLTSILLPENCVGAEIGVYKGITTAYLAQCPHIIKIYGIDPWSDIDGYEDSEHLLREVRKNSISHGEPIDAETWDKLFIKVKDKLSKYEKIKLIRSKSQDAVLLIKKGIDFVFIDGDHSYDSVMQDISIWSNKLKNGGIILGHDYSWNAEHGSKRGLCQAVHDYFNKHSNKFEPVLDVARNDVINREHDRVWWQRNAASRNNRTIP